MSTGEKKKQVVGYLHIRKYFSEKGKELLRQHIGSSSDSMLSRSSPTQKTTYCTTLLFEAVEQAKLILVKTIFKKSKNYSVCRGERGDCL